MRLLDVLLLALAAIGLGLSQIRDGEGSFKGLPTPGWCGWAWLLLGIGSLLGILYSYYKHGWRKLPPKPVSDEELLQSKAELDALRERELQEDPMRYHSVDDRYARWHTEKAFPELLNNPEAEGKTEPEEDVSH